jgi:hypothetical protein
MSMYRVAVLVRTGLAECVLVQWDARGQAWIIPTLVEFNIYAFRFPAILCILLDFGLAHYFLSLSLSLLAFFDLPLLIFLPCFFLFCAIFLLLTGGTSSADKLGKRTEL